MTLHIGNKVDKVKGYRLPGTIVSVFAKLDGQVRYVIEMDEYGLLHIYSEKDLVLKDISGAPGRR